MYSSRQHNPLRVTDQASGSPSPNGHIRSMPAVPVLQPKNSKEEPQMKKVVSSGIAPSSPEVVQRLKWTRVNNKIRVYNDQDGSDRAPGDDEINASIATNEWRPGTVWDDDNNKWLQKSDNGLIDRKEDMEIGLINVATYDEGEDKNFGHRFDFSVWMKAHSIKWWEKTAKPYVDTMEPNEWTDMYAAYKSSSAVFAGAKNMTAKYQAYTFNDPPGILHQPDNKRLLEFKLEFEDKNSKKGLITAKQDLETDNAGKITKQDFNLQSQSIT